MYKSAHSSSLVSRDGSLSTPFASRPFLAKLSTDYPEGLHRSMSCRQDYYSLSDPHLTQYFRKKLLLSSLHSPHQSRTSSSLSFRSTSSFSTRSSISKVRHIPSPQSYVYKVSVKTGSSASAGTSSRVYVSLQGSKGTLKRRRLMRGGRASEFSFLPGTTEKFRIKGRDIGDLSHVTIESGGLRKEDAWYVDSVTINNEKGDKWLCPCNHWLSLYHTDCQLSRTLKVKLQRPEKSVEQCTVYVVEVVTGDVRGGGTEANVFLVLEGDRKSSSKQQLCGEFDRGSVIKSEVRCTENLGLIKAMVVGHDNSGFGADWFLDQVVLYPQDRPQDKLYFPCAQWLSRTQGDGLIERCLTGSVTAPDRRLPQNYVVSALTGGMRGAGTSANVFITLYGERGASEERRLDNDPGNFERGRRDRFLFSCPELGKLSKVRIRHDNSGVGASWFLVEVVVEGGRRGENEEEMVRFPCGRWLEMCDGCGGQVEAELFPVGVAGSKYTLEVGKLKDEEEKECVYSVTTETGDQPGAGTSANPYVILCGKGGTHSDRLVLDNGNRSLCAGQIDHFRVKYSGRLYSPLESVTVGHDNSGPSPGWLLREMKVECESSGESWRFPCDQWLCLDRDDGRIVRELHPSLPPSANVDFNSKWEVHVFTSDARGAGTDANVTLQLHGSKGSSHPAPLGDNIANFEQGEHDIFQGVELPGRLGVLDAVTVSHDGTGPYPDWHLDKVQLRNLLTAEEYHCQCSRWLCSDNGNSVRLPAMPVHPLELRTDLLRAGSTPRTASTSRISPRDGRETLPVLEEVDSSQPQEQDSSITNKYLRQLRNEQVTPTSFTVQTESDHNSSSSPSKSPSQSTIPYTVHVVGGAPPAGDLTPFLQVILCGHKGQSQPISLEPLGTRPPSGTPETYSVEGSDVGGLTSIKIRLVGSSATPWFIHKITIHSPTYGHTHQFVCERGVVCGDSECVLEVMDVLGSSVNTSTVESTPRISAANLVAYEVKVITADKKNAGTSNSLYLVIVGEDATSRTFTFKNSSRTPQFQRGQTDSFQVATPPLGQLSSVRVAHCPRKKSRTAAYAGGSDKDNLSWYLFQVILTCLSNRTRSYFLCRRWVEPSFSTNQLNFTEIQLSKTEK